MYTPPVKAATKIIQNMASDAKISIHAAREGGDLVKHCLTLLLRISIHAAREGGDNSNGQ